MEGSMVSGSGPRFGVVAVTAALLVALAGWAPPSSAQCPSIEYVRVCDRSAQVGWTYDESGDAGFGGYRVWTCQGEGCIDVDDMALCYEFVLGDDDPQSPTYWPFGPYVPDVVRTVAFIDSIVTLENPPDTIQIEIGSPFRALVTAFAVGEEGLDEACLDEEHISRNIYTGPEIVFARVGDRSAAIGWTMGAAEEEIKNNAGTVVFGGYRIWMRELWKSGEFSLVRQYDLGQDDPDAAGYWPFDAYYLQPVRGDSGAFFQNAFPYQFSVTMFTVDDPESSDVYCKEGNLTEVLYPRVGVQTDLASVQVIPNPYRSSADWERGGQRRVTFVGLPHEATIRIYTVAADHVITLKPKDQRDDQHDWDLTNKDGEEIAPGVYIWQVEGGGGTKYGRIMIIK
jgi:hypothetical protein